MTQGCILPLLAAINLCGHIVQTVVDVLKWEGCGRGYIKCSIVKPKSIRRCGFCPFSEVILFYTSVRGHDDCPLHACMEYRGCPLLGGLVMGGSTVKLVQ